MIKIKRKNGVKDITKYQKKSYLVLGVVILLHLTAVIIDKFNTEVIWGETHSTIMSITRSCCYIVLFVLWGVYVRHRIVIKKIQRYLLEICFFMIFWMLVRAIKYVLVDLTDVERGLWYLYYIPILCIPVLCLTFAESVGKQKEQEMIPKWIYLPMVISLILIVMVLTNDFHQMVFIFPKDSLVFSDSNYRYGIGYYIILGWITLCVTNAFVDILLKCRIPRSRRIHWLPVISLFTLLVGTILSIKGVTWVRWFDHDITVTICLFTVTILESCIVSGLIPSNSHYEELFLATSLPVCITDMKYENPLINRNFDATMCNRLLMEESRREAIVIDKKTRLSASDIPDGYAFWTEDVSQMIELLDDLKDVQKSLEERHTLAKEEYRVQKEKARLTEVNRLYYEMQNQTKGYLDRMQQLTKKLSEISDPEQEKILLTELLLQGAYFKRRNNLLFISETQKKIRGAELEYCLKESFSALSFSEVTGAYFVDLGEEIALTHIITLYDLVQNVLEQTKESLESIAVFIRESEQGYDLDIELCTAKEQEFAFDSRFEVEKEGACEYTLICQLRKEMKDAEEK